jgi:hypothetical protein
MTPELFSSADQAGTRLSNALEHVRIFSRREAFVDQEST